ncbi:hypothetical protein YC2023_049155 [Brassica napus]
MVTTKTMSLIRSPSEKTYSALHNELSQKLIVAKRQQPQPTAKAAFAGGSGKTSHALNPKVSPKETTSTNMINKHKLIRRRRCGDANAQSTASEGLVALRSRSTETTNELPSSINRIYGFYDGFNRRFSVRLWKITTIKRPTDVPDFGQLCDLLWSDQAKMSNWQHESGEETFDAI